jgi:hypothetical protein
MPLICPCCGQPATSRKTPITADECEVGYRLMLRRGLTRDTILAEHGDTLDQPAPGMTDWLRMQPP